MPSGFDPYYKWLGIPPEHQPPDHYRLCGVTRYEPNLDVISNAIDARMAHLRTFQSGPHAADSQKLLNELSAASTVLLNPEKKAVYDRQLRAQEAQAAPKPAPAKPGAANAAAQSATAKPTVARAPQAQRPIAKPKGPLPQVTPLAEAPVVATVIDAPVPAAPYAPRPNLPSSFANPVLLAVGGGVGGLVVLAVIVGVVWNFMGGSPSPDPSGPTIAEGSPNPPKPPPSAPPPVVEDEQPKQTSLNLAQEPTLAQYPYALRLRRGQSVEIAESQDAVAFGQEFTAEMWVRWTLDTTGQSLFETQSGWGLMVFKTGTPRVVLYYDDPAAGRRTSDRPSVADGGQWQHVAICGQRGRLRVFIGGQKVVDQAVSDTPLAAKGNLRLSTLAAVNAQASAYHEFRAFRLSSTARYRDQFTPPTILVPDNMTLALYDFRTPKADQVADASGKQRHGRLTGGEWIDLRSNQPIPLPPAEAVAVAGVQESNETIDLVAKADPAKDVLRGSASFFSDHIVLTGQARPDQVRLNTGELPEEYILEMTATRLEGDESLNIGLIIDGQQTMMDLDSFPMWGKFSGLDSINSKRTYEREYPSAFKGEVLPQGQAVNLRFEVKKDSLVASKDGQQFFQWQGDARRLGIFPAYRPPQPMLFLSSWAAKFRIGPVKLIVPKQSAVAAADPPLDDPMRDAVPMPQPPQVAVDNQPPLRVPDDEPPGAPAIDRRKPAPGEAELKTARDNVHQILEDDLAKAQRPEQKLTLARKLIDLARESKDEPHAQYVLFEEASRHAALGGDLRLAFDAIDELCQIFAADAYLLKAGAIKEIAPLARTTAERTQLATTILELVDEAAVNDQLDAAQQLLRQATTVAAKADPKLRTEVAARTRDIDDRQRQAKLAEQAAERLKTEPDNPKANLAYGKYLCFVKDNWEQGLPHLKKGDDKALKDLAAAEEGNPSETEKQADLADQWWQVAQRAPSVDKVGMLQRAVYWYEKAQDAATGLTKARIEKRLDEIRQTLPASALAKRSKTIDVIKLIDPVKDAIKGDWSVENGVLICSTQHFVPKIYIPYIPGEEYDIKITFSQPRIRHPVSIVMPKAGASFYWQVGGTTGEFSFSVRPANGGRNPTESRFPGIVVPNRPYTSVVQVRNNGVRAFFEGKLVAQYQTDFSDLQVDSWHEIPDRSRMAICCDDPTIFHAIEIQEVTGKGIFTRESK